MIDADRTLSVLGVDVSTLTPGSGKMVFRVCEDCGGYKPLEYNQAIKIHLCKSCAASIHHADVSGKNNPRHVPAPPKEEIERLYIIEEVPKYKLAKMFGVWSGVVDRWLHEYNIPNRGLPEARSLLDTVGENNPNWRGGITALTRDFRHSHEYQMWRKSVFSRDKYTCRKCGTRDLPLAAHHILPVKDWKGPQYSMNVANGITLCEDCHKEVTGREYDFFSTLFDLANGIGGGVDGSFAN